MDDLDMIVAINTNTSEEERKMNNKLRAYIQEPRIVRLNTKEFNIFCRYEAFKKGSK